MALESLSVTAEHLPELNVEGQPITVVGDYYSVTKIDGKADASELLKQLPGASATRNGPLSGIAQYRGLQGDQISVSIDSGSVATGGPNAMDAPLSYIPSKLLKELRVSNGIASVSSAPESFGGHIQAVSRRGSFAEDSNPVIGGFVGADYSDQNEGLSAAGLVYYATDKHKLSASSSFDSADDSTFSDGDIVGTEYERRRHNLMYDALTTNGTWSVTLGKNNTGDSGTPALAMDILSIDTDIVQVSTSQKWLGAVWAWSLSYSDVDHLMTNFHLRENSNPMAHRQNHATGEQWLQRFSVVLPIQQSQLKVGFDLQAETHDSVITNPNAALRINNFNNVERNINGLFAEWTRSEDDWSMELGARYNRVEMDADEVSVAGLPMPMMQMNFNTLADSFNAQNRDQTDHNQDVVAKFSYKLNQSLTFDTAVSHKERAPSYQQRYLWLPLAATGGLADGRNYMGNVDLESEKSDELNLALSYKGSDGGMSVSAFVREIDDYIQGGEVLQGPNAMLANMIARMMNGSGQDALQFQNVDARIYGAEVVYDYSLSQDWSFSGVLSYSRGKRTDLDDNLYRLAPLRHSLTVSYEKNDWAMSATSEIVAAQNKVSEFNSESQSSGYGLIHFRTSYQATPDLVITAGVDNLFDRKYRDHLAGINRVSGNPDIGVGERLFSPGRSINAGFEFQW